MKRESTAGAWAQEERVNAEKGAICPLEERTNQCSMSLGSERYGASPPPEVQQRIEYELGVIESMGFSAYFLVMWDLVAYAKSRGIRVGPGRGSAAGSCVAYCLRIVDIDQTTLWKGKKKDGDPRNGPWFASVHEVLDQQVWDTRAECLYFLTDGRGQVRYVGESKNRIADRWRMPPAACPATGRDLGNAFVFHNRAWAPLEAAFVLPQNIRE